MLDSGKQRRFLGTLFLGFFTVASLSVSFPAASMAQGVLPSLENAPQGEAITPISDLMPTGPVTLDQAELDKPSLKPLKTMPAAPPENPAPADHAMGAPVPAEIPAVHQAKPGFMGFLNDKFVKPVSYSPLPAIVIFPVVKHGKEKAFGDLPVLFAREYALGMERKAPETRVYHPVYTVDELRIRGLGHVYDQIMDYYLKAGRPEPAAMDYLLKQFANDGRPISRVIFVEADLDTTHPAAATGAWERISQVLTDGQPKQMKYFVNSRLQAFDAEDPNFPMVWGGSWSRSIKTDQFYNVTPSVFAAAN